MIRIQYYFELRGLANNHDKGTISRDERKK